MLYYSSGRLSQHLLWLAALAGVAGLLASRALVALSPVVGVLAALANPHLGRSLPRYSRNGAALRAAAMVLFLLLSSIYTTEWGTWRHELFRSLPWLAWPLAFTLAVPLTARQRGTVGALFVLGTAAVGLVTLGQYLLDPAEANLAIQMGQNMQASTHIFHVHFGTMLALACFGGLLLAQNPLTGKWLRAGLWTAAAAAVITLHVLAYRTGLLALYAGGLAYAGWWLTRRRVLLGLGMLALLGLGPWVAYHTLESVRNRVHTTAYEVGQFTEQRDINDFSLARRLAAVETAVAVIRQHWLVGVGPADAHAAMMDQYAWRDFGLRPANRVEVHNQYLDTMVGSGLLGLALLLALLFGPLARASARHNPYICFFIVVQAAVMVVVDVWSLQIGLNLFVLGYSFLVVAEEAQHQAPELTVATDC